MTNMMMTNMMMMMTMISHQQGARQKGCRGMLPPVEVGQCAKNFQFSIVNVQRTRKPIISTNPGWMHGKYCFSFLCVGDGLMPEYHEKKRSCNFLFVFLFWFSYQVFLFWNFPYRLFLFLYQLFLFWKLSTNLRENALHWPVFRVHLCDDRTIVF